MGEGLQARPFNAGGSAVLVGSDLEVLTHRPTVITRLGRLFERFQTSRIDP